MRGRTGSFPSWSLALLIAVMLTVPVSTGETGGDAGSRATPPVPVEFQGFTDEFNDTSNVVLDGPVVLEDGYLTLDLPKTFSDDFERTDVAPWAVEAGVVRIENGSLKLYPSLFYDTVVSRSIWQEQVRLEGKLKCASHTRGGPLITFNSYRHVMGFDYYGGKLRVWEDDRYLGFKVYESVPFTLTPDRWYDFAVEFGYRVFRFSVEDLLIENVTDRWNPTSYTSVELGSTSTWQVSRPKRPVSSATSREIVKA